MHIYIWTYTHICRYAYMHIYVPKSMSCHKVIVMITGRAIGTESKCTKRWKQSSAIKQLLETLFLAIKMCTGFTTDGMCMNTMCAVSLANHFRTVADAFRPLRTHQHY